MSCYVSVVCDLYLFTCSYHKLLETFLQFFAIFDQIREFSCRGLVIGKIYEEIQIFYPLNLVPYCEVELVKVRQT